MRWEYKQASAETTRSLADGICSQPPFRQNRALTELLACLLIERGIDRPEAALRFLSPSLNDLHSPYLMTGMTAAVERLEAAIERRERVLIYGDYDVDGTTAVVILKTAVELCGGATDFHVPHRILEGYDLRGDVIERAAAAGIRLVISVDAGTRAFAAAECARRLGVDLIITDHHLPGPAGLPPAYAVVNPNQPGCEYPSKSLCAAGIALKLAQALMAKRLPARDHSQLLVSFMKIAAIATIADAVPLVGESRVIASLGLNALRSAVNPGLKALLEVAQLGGKPLSSGEVAFRIAPRINAAGRMDVARDVIELFSVKDPLRAREIAQRLDTLNGERQEQERRIVGMIEQRLAEDSRLRDAFCIVIDGPGWHRGVIGITAKRIVERYGRPVLVISSDGQEGHGSGRSIPGFHLLQALESCENLLSRYGGHAQAVGFSLPAARIAELQRHLDSYARARLSPRDFESVIQIDAALTLDAITPELFAVVRMLEPFGTGNPQPVFASVGARLIAVPKILKDKHVRLKLAPNLELAAPTGWRRSLTHSAMGWWLAERVTDARLLPGDLVNIAFTLDRNEHPEFGGLELSVRDFEPGLRVQSAQSTS